MFRQLSKITLKYTSSLFPHYYQDHITPKLVESWLKDLQIGIVRSIVVLSLSIDS